MDFVKYEDILPNLLEQGLVEVQDDHDLIRLEMNPDLDLKTHHVRDADSKVLPLPEAQVIEKSKADLPEVLDDLLGKLHLNEVLVIPVGEWSNIINCVAFDLAADEDWIEIDAMAAMHQNTRNALAVPRAETHVLVQMIRALFNNADQPKQDLIITSDVKPILIEIFYDGAMSITTEPGVARELAPLMQ